MTFYKTITFLLYPLFYALLIIRLILGKENARSFKEKRGSFQKKRPDKKLAWFHAASVGESLSLLYLLDTLAGKHADWQFMITTGTISSGGILEEKLKNKDQIFHQYLPFDHPIWVNRFFDYWKPDLSIVSESDFWPNFMTESKNRDIPLVLVNGRMSPKSFNNWSKIKKTARALFSKFDLTIVQTEQDEVFFNQLGAKNIVKTGNLKYSNPPLGVNREDLDILSKKLKDRKLWFFSQSHESEEEIAINAHKSLSKDYKNLTTIIALRHPNRKDEVKKILGASGLSHEFRSDVHNDVNPKVDIYIVDTFGELGIFYSLCEITCIGGSFKPLGCHNPIEPAQLNCAILFGPHIFNFSETCSDLINKIAAIQVKNEDGLIEKLDYLLQNEDVVTSLQSKALAFTKSKSETLSLVESQISSYLK